MKKNLIQWFADFIIYKMAKTKSDKTFYEYLNLGLMLDFYCVNYLDLYLD